MVVLGPTASKIIDIINEIVPFQAMVLSYTKRTMFAKKKSPNVASFCFPRKTRKANLELIHGDNPVVTYCVLQFQVGMHQRSK